MSEELTHSPPQEHQPSILPAGLVEGKRLKKTVERLDLQARKQTEKLKIGDGSGDKLGDIPRINYQISRIKPADLKPLHAILFDRPGKISTVKKNLRLFNGFSFPADGDQFTKKREKILRSFTNSKLKVMCGVLDLEKKGTHSDLVDRIMGFLAVPTNSGKLLPAKKKKKKKKRVSGDGSQARSKKQLQPKARRSSSSSPKKAKAGSKSHAIVMDSSSDEEEEEDERAEPKEESSDAEKMSEKEEQISPVESEQDEDEEDEEDEEEESHKSKTSRAKPPAKKATPTKKAPPTKRQRASAKRPAPPRKRVKKVSDESDSDTDEKTNKKKPAATKTKKADSSSQSRNTTNTADDQSDEDEPLINMIKKAPRDDQLRETVESLLKEANLEEMTMKQICQKVFDTYPEHDLSGKKDYIKQTVKSLIT